MSARNKFSQPYRHLIAMLLISFSLVGGQSTSPTISQLPTVVPTTAPSSKPSLAASDSPTFFSSISPTGSSSQYPTETQSGVEISASNAPTVDSSSAPSVIASNAPTSSKTPTTNPEPQLPPEDPSGQLPLGDSSSLNRYHECPNSSFNPAIVKGKRFFDSGTGEYIPIKGIAYYSRPNDGPLSITHSVDFFTETYRDLWEVDIQNFVKLGINTLRIYGVDPSQNHDAFMCALQDAGIYVIFGLLADCEDCGILAEEAPACYPPSLKGRGQFIINTFSKYRNTLAFSAGNEVAWYAKEAGGDTSWNAPCQKQFIRDMRSYIKTCNAVVNSILPRKVPIGVVVADFDGSLNAKYYGCRTDPIDLLENVEWYGINSYRHCDPKAVSVDDLEGFKLLKDDFLTYGLPIPVVLAEFGCRERFPTIGDFEAQRTWLQVDALFNEDYQEAFAGGVVFEYSAEKRIVDTSDQNKPWPYYEFSKFWCLSCYLRPCFADTLGLICWVV